MISCPDATIPLGVCHPPTLQYKIIPIRKEFKHICKLTINDDKTEAIYTHISYNYTWDDLECTSNKYIQCCTIMADGDNIDSYVERWCEKVHKADGVIQYDIDLPARFAADCNPVSLILYILVGIIFAVLAGLLISHYSRQWFPLYGVCPFGGPRSLSASDLSKNVLHSRDVEVNLLVDHVHEMKIAPPRLTSDITYCMDDGRATILGEGRYGIVYKAMHGENYVAVKCTERQDKAEHEKIMFNLIGSRSDYLLRLTAYVSKHCDPYNRPTSIIVVPAYLRGNLGTFLAEKRRTDGGISTDLALKLISSLSCGIYQLHRPSEGIENPLPCIAHRDLKPANVLISDNMESVICDFNSAVPLVRELPHKCECFNRSTGDGVLQHRPFEPYALIDPEQHGHPACQNRKILQQIDKVRDKCFDQKCPDGTWLYMAPEILSLKMFDVDEVNVANSDIVSRYCSTDIYSFSLIAWTVMSQCKEIEPSPIPDGIDDYLFAEFLTQSKLAPLPTRNLMEKEIVMDRLVNYEAIRPRCNTHPIYEQLKECWAAEGPCRPDARQLYKRIKNLISTNITSYL